MPWSASETPSEKLIYIDNQQGDCSYAAALFLSAGIEPDPALSETLPRVNY
jgi:hypothetical protein